MTSTAALLWADCEIPSGHRTPYPWQHEIATRLPTFLRLHGEMTDDQVATAVAGLCTDNELPVGDDTATSLRGLRAARDDRHGLIFCGGLQLHAGGNTLGPGCCSGLEHWREWPALLETGEPVWWGHAPDGQVELIDTGAVRATSGGGSIDLPRTQYAALVDSVAADLAAFLCRLRQWLAAAAPALAVPVTELVSRELDVPITGRSDY